MVIVRIAVGLLCCAWTSAALGSEDALPRNHPKHKTSEQVFDRLVRAIGDGRTPPVLRLVPADVASTVQVAWFDRKSTTVALEERVYDLFVELGPDSLDALAWLLGHELAHYYQDHGWTGDFGNGFIDLEVGRKLKALSGQRSKAVEIETEADYFGGFFGQVAGYRTLDIIPNALELVYAEYELDPELTGYPSLGERQEIARRAAGQLQQLVPIFKVGNGLLLLGLYEEAGRCFDHIAQTFPSREILNNAGVARALEAMALFEDGEVRFAYPLELDAATRLQQGGKADEAAYEESRFERRVRLLQASQRAFEQARERDDAYAPAYVNLACVMDLLGEYEDAEYWARKAARLAREHGDGAAHAHALIAQGIAAAHLDPADRDGPSAAFAQARESAPVLAALNLAVLQGGGPGAVQDRAAGQRGSEPETIAGLGGDDYQALIEAPDVKTRVPQGSWGQPAMTVYARQTDDWDGLLVDTGYSTVVLLSTQEAYDGESGLGIRRGQELTQVEERYGPATRGVSGRQERYFVYESSRIVFRADPEGRVRGWMVYGIK